MQHLSFTVVEMLHIVALIPCLFAIILLLVLNRFSLKILVPCLFFVALSSTFLLGLSSVLYTDMPKLQMFFVWLESLQPAFCFLLIIQLWRDRVPSAIYWLILALPIFGGSSLVIASLQLEDFCVMGDYCLQTFELRSLYQFFATALIFLLLMVHLGRIPIVSTSGSRYQSHRYWLMIALVIAYASLMMVDLFALMRQINMLEREIIHVVMRLGFMYLVLTSLFRLFDQKGNQLSAAAKLKPVDALLVEQIKQTLAQEKMYREMNFNREQFAKKLDVPEHVLSRAINQALGKNFNEFVNSYRIEEAKQRLAAETTSVTAIAFEVGFSSIASFNRVFKAMVRCSPTEYRQTNAGS